MNQVGALPTVRLKMYRDDDELTVADTTIRRLHPSGGHGYYYLSIYTTHHVDIVAAYT